MGTYGAWLFLSNWKSRPEHANDETVDRIAAMSESLLLEVDEASIPGLDHDVLLLSCFFVIR